MDSAYLKEHVGKALTLGLAEIAQKKPVDPIEYLSKWLRKHVENLQDEADVKLLFDLFMIFILLSYSMNTIFVLLHTYFDPYSDSSVIFFIRNMFVKS